MTGSSHPIDALHDALSGRLSADERRVLDAHLDACDACRREYEALAWVREQTAAARADVPVPVDLEASLLRALDAEDAAVGRASAPPAATATMTRRRWLALGGAATAAAAAGVLFRVWQTGRPDVPAEVARDFRAYTAGTLALGLRTTEPAMLDTHLRAASLPFDSRVFDFGMMQYELEGGGLHQVDRRPSALFAYRGPGDLRIVCQMYEGDLNELPPPDRRRANDGIDFLVYDEDGATIVFWREGAVLCVLAANGDPDGAVALAFAKAVRV